ncbi:MAG TPA: hypothetical protein VFS03_01885, partial [Microvirga sp.]|nr:hypothetical protein [Microvirga sp.]
MNDTTMPLEDRIEPLSGLLKGMPAGAGALPLAAVARQGWNILREDLALPVAVLRRSALERNGLLHHADEVGAPAGL